MKSTLGMRGAASVLPGEQVRLTGGPLIEIVRVAEPAAHLLRAVDLYGRGSA